MPGIKKNTYYRITGVFNIYEEVVSLPGSTRFTGLSRLQKHLLWFANQSHV